MLGNILITCSTGGLGALTIKFLLSKNVSPSRIFAQVRDPRNPSAIWFAKKGVTIRKADYTDIDSVNEAMAGIDTLVFISSGDFDRWEQHQNVLKCIQNNDSIKHVIYTSYIQCDKCSAKCKVCSGHLQTEEAIKAMQIQYTIFRMTIFPEYVLLDMMGPDEKHALTSGHWYRPGGSSKVNLVARSDVAEALCRLLFDPRPHVNKTYEIVSGNLYTFEDISHILTKATGKEILYTPIQLNEYEDMLRHEGYPEDHVEYLYDGAVEIDDV